jgi:hypothetical protein
LSLESILSSLDYNTTPIAYLLLGSSLLCNSSLLGDSLLLGGRLLGLGRKLVGSLDLHEDASLNSTLESGLQNVLLDGSLEKPSKTGVRLVSGETWQAVGRDEIE